jgi:trigger factor
MQVTELEKKGLKVVLKVVVEADRIREQTEAELKSAGERVKIPGFRPGYIPMKVLQQRYGKAVEADVIKQVVSRSSSEALATKKIRPVATPKVDLEKGYKEGADLSFTLTVESFPPVPQVVFDKITLERQTYEIADSDIAEASARIAERSPNFERAKEGTKAKEGHVVNIDFKGMIDGVPFDGGTAQNFRLELGSGQFIAGFEEQLYGKKEGEECKVNVTFPKEYHAESLAGKPAVFEVKINEIFSKELPVIDEKFATERGFADLKALHEAIRSQLAKEYDQIVRTRLKKQLFDHLDETVDFELPETMVEMEFSSIWERLQQARAEGDESIIGRSDEDLKEEYQGIARRRVKLGIMLAETGAMNNIHVSREELGRAAMQQASMFPGQERQVMEFYKNNPERLEDLRGPILEEKAVDFVLGKVSFNDTKISTKELTEEDESAETAKKASSGGSSKSAKAKSSSKKQASEE